MFYNILNIIRRNIEFFIFGIPSPLAISFCITKKCQLHCSYCNIPNEHSKDLNTKQVFKLFDSLKKMGCVRLGLTGGEPLLRDDIDRVIKYAKKKGFYLTINTNGILLKEHIDIWKYINMVFISLDGYEDRQQNLRGGLTNNEIFSLIKDLRKKKVKVLINCLLNNQSIEEIDYLLSNASKYDFLVDFELFSDHSLSGEKPYEKKIISLLEHIIKLKRSKHNIVNSNYNLLLMKNSLLSNRFPHSLKCFAGKTFAFIDNDGKFYPCFDMRGALDGVSDFNKLSKIDDYCNFCRCNGSIEMNSVYSLRLNAILESFKWW